MENQIMPKQYIEFKCQHQRIERTDDFFVVGGSQRYLYAKFDLCSDWSGLQQYAVFTGGLKTFRIPIVDGECEVPWEMLLEKRFFVGCEAGQRITSNAAEVKVHPCGAPEETGTPRKPTPTLQSQVGNLNDLKTEAKENLVEAINEVYDKEGNGGGSVPGNSGIHIGSEPPTDKNIILWINPDGANGDDPDDDDDDPVDLDGYATEEYVDKQTQAAKDYTDEKTNAIVNRLDTDEDRIGTHIPFIEAAKPGQHLIVREVDDNGKPTSWDVVDGYTLPVATPDTLGGVKPAAKTNEMNIPVGVDALGGLWSVGGLQRVGMSDSVVTLEPNKFYVFPEMGSLSVSFGGGSDTSIVQEYKFRFISGETPTTLSLPENVKGEITVYADSVVEVSVVDHYAVSHSWAVSE